MLCGRSTSVLPVSSFRKACGPPSRWSRCIESTGEPSRGRRGKRRAYPVASACRTHQNSALAKRGDTTISPSIR
eukprot:scaffold2003_cov119-Isochrysis_galbana.AAC.3